MQHHMTATAVSITLATCLVAAAPLAPPAARPTRSAPAVEGGGGRRVGLVSAARLTLAERPTDGRRPRISPNGEYATYETGPTAATVTRIMKVTSGAARQVAELPGVEAGFDPASTRLVYVRPVRDAQWTSAVNALSAAASAAERATVQAQIDLLVAKGDLVVRDLASGAEQVVPTAGLLKTAPVFSADGAFVLFIGSQPSDLSRSDIYLAGTGTPTRLTDEPGYKSNVLVDPSGAALVYTVTTVASFGPAAAGAGRPAAAGQAAPGGTPRACGADAATASFGVVDLHARTTRIVGGSGVKMSADGSTLAWLSRSGNVCALNSSPTLRAAVNTNRSAAR